MTVDAGYRVVKSAGLLGADDTSRPKIGAGYTFGDFKVGVVYEDVSDYDGFNDRDSVLVSGAYNMGAITLKALYGQADVDTAASDLDQICGPSVHDYALSSAPPLMWSMVAAMTTAKPPTAAMSPAGTWA
ncbi:MAG: porin [Hydrogenophilales bacterium]|nr:porin [Hydrogenophilales bacterium]